MPLETFAENNTQDAEKIMEVPFYDVRRPLIPMLDEKKVCNLVESIGKVCIILLQICLQKFYIIFEKKGGPKSAN